MRKVKKNASVKASKKSVSKQSVRRKTEDKPKRAPAVERALRILELIVGSRQGLTPAELSDKLDIAKSSMSILLNTLAAENYVRRDGEGRYRLGMHILNFSGLSIYELGLQTEIIRAARKYLQRIVDETGLGANLAILDHTSAIYIERIEPPVMPSLLKIDIRPGQRMAPQITAIGKALICRLDKDSILKIWKENPINYQEFDGAIKNFDELLLDLEKARNLGYATDHGEHDPNVRCVAAPVLSTSGSVIAAISVNGTLDQLNDENESRIAEVVRGEAKELSKYLKKS